MSWGRSGRGRLSKKYTKPSFSIPLNMDVQSPEWKNLLIQDKQPVGVLVVPSPDKNSWTPSVEKVFRAERGNPETFFGKVFSLHGSIPKLDSTELSILGYHEKYDKLEWGLSTDKKLTDTLKCMYDASLSPNDVRCALKTDGTARPLNPIETTSLDIQVPIRSWLEYRMGIKYASAEVTVEVYHPFTKEVVCPLRTFRLDDRPLPDFRYAYFRGPCGEARKGKSYVAYMWLGAWGNHRVN